MKFYAVSSVVFFLIVLCQSALCVNRLSVNGNKFIFNCKNVFLSGVNFAWNSYGYDFGNGQYAANSQTVFNSWLSEVALNGGNTIRVWVHIEGNNTPNFGTNGYIIAPDNTGTLVSDMLSFLNAAKAKNIVVIFVLWNGALLRNQNAVNLFWDTGKLQSYITNALTPMVSGLSGHPALAAWEIINEPEGLVYNNKYNGTNCFNTQPLANTGAGWTGLYIPIQLIQRFINWQAAAIHQTDPGALVTVGSWSEHAITDSHTDSRNFYSDACLLSAGGQVLGKLDFYQVHTYATYGAYAPFKVVASGYNFTKPLLIGEFSASCSGGMTSQQQYSYAYNNGYGGALGWQYAGGYCADSASTLDSGYKAILQG